MHRSVSKEDTTRRGTLARCYKVIAIVLLNAAIVTACLNAVAAAVVLLLRLSPDTSEPPDARSRSSYYAGKAWASQYWKEFAESRREQYHAFTVWRRAPFKGETVNIDARGIRVTPGAACGPGSFTVFVFGSSHMWGTGAPDWATIPAYLQERLAGLISRPVCVVNFGQSGYTSTQSLITLTLELQAGHRPDVAVFLDGAGDIYAAYQSGRVDVHMNFETTSARMERRDLPTRPLIVQTIEATSLFRLVSDQIGRLSAGTADPELVTYESLKVDRGPLATAVVDAFLGNCKMVDALAKQYGFAYYYFWPPHISKGSKTLTDEEQTEKAAVAPAFQRLLDTTYQAVETRHSGTCRSIFFLDHLFDRETSLIWLDDVHTTPVGNRMIAEKMAQVVQDHEPPRVGRSGEDDGSAGPWRIP